MISPTLQGPAKDFALHTIGWQAFQDLAASIAESEFGRPVTRVAKSADEGRDGFFYGVPDEPLSKGDKRQTTIQSKHLSSPTEKLTVGKLALEMVSVLKLVESGRADGYVLMTNANLSEGDRKKIVAALEACGVERPYVLGRDWVVAKILEFPRVRALAPRVYGLGDLSWITDQRALAQAEAIIDSMGNDLACYVPTTAHRDAVVALDKHSIVLLLGDPAVGKTSIAAALSIAATDEDNCDVIYVRNPPEFVASWDPDLSDRLYWIDDAFGSIQYRPELADSWNKVFQTMRAAVKRGNRFILTSRSYIWTQARNDLKMTAYSPLLDGSVVVDVENLTPAEKERILYNHLKFGKQPNSFLTRLDPFLDTIVRSSWFTPEMARRLGDPAFTGNVSITLAGVLDFFRHPERFLRDTISNLERPLKAAIGLIFVNAGRLVSPVANDPAAKLITDSYGVTLADLRSALTAMKGSFVNFVNEDEESYWTYKHPTIADAYAGIVGRDEELIAVYLSGTKTAQILREARCGGVVAQGASVPVGVSQYDLLLDRFDGAEGISEGDIRRFLITRCGPRFLKAFAKRYPDMMPWGSGLSRPARADDRTRFILKAHQNGLLPTDERARFLGELELQVIEDADIDFLIDDPEMDAFLTVPEREQLVSLTRGDFVRNLERSIDVEADAFENGWDPDDWFMYLRQTIAALERLFPEDEEIAAAAEVARDRIADKVTEIQCRLDEDEDDENCTPPPGQAAVSSSERSIFEDLTSGR